MLKFFVKQDEEFEKASLKAAKKFGLDAKEIDFVSYDNFLWSLVFMLAISGKKAYLLSTDNKKPETFDLRDIDKIYIEKKTDLNLLIKGGRVINLTSVVGVKPKVMKLVNRLGEELKNLR